MENQAKRNEDLDLVTDDLADAIGMLPGHMREGAVNYYLYGQEPGGFHQAVLENDLHQAASKADPINAGALMAWANYLDKLPGWAWGSKDDIRFWMKEGGLVGMTRTSKAKEGQS